MHARPFTFLVALSLTVSGVLLCVAESDRPALLSSEMGGKDLAFLTAIADAAILQTNLGEMAKMRGSDEGVKLIGEAVAASHAEAKTELQMVTAKKGVSVTTTPNRGQIALIDRVSKHPGLTFDQACLEEMIRVLAGEIAQLESAAQSTDAEVKAFAEKLLPQLREQFLLAKKIAARPQGPASVGREKILGE